MTGTSQAVLDLLRECDHRGMRLIPVGEGRLTIDAAEGALDQELQDRLKLHKEELLAVVSVPPDNYEGTELEATQSEDSQMPVSSAPSSSSSADCKLAFPLAGSGSLPAPGKAAWEPDGGMDDRDDSPGPRLDGWPENCISLDAVDPCERCGSRELWQSYAGNWHLPTVQAVGWSADA
jgi:hypothetical protein